MAAPVRQRLFFDVKDEHIIHRISITLTAQNDNFSLLRQREDNRRLSWLELRRHTNFSPLLLALHHSMPLQHIVGLDRVQRFLTLACEASEDKD